MHLKLRDFNTRNVPLNITQSFVINNTTYHLQSAMLYTGTGCRGHWRSLVKESDRYIMYDDAQLPRHITLNELQTHLKNGTDFIYIGEQTNKNFHPASTSSVTDTNITTLPVSQSKTYQCDTYVAKFATKQMLPAHVNKPHFSEDVTCLVCNQVFGSEHETNVHLKDVHDVAYSNTSGKEDNANATTNPARLSCIQCNYSTEKQSNLKRHVKSKHPENKESPEPLQNEPCTPSKRKDIESPITTPLKRLNLEDNYSDENDTTPPHITPLKRKPMTSTEIESPLKRLNIDEDAPNITPDSFKKPMPPSATPRGPRTGLKTFTLEELNAKKCNPTLT